MTSPRYAQMGEYYLLVVLGEQPTVVLGDGEVPEEMWIDGHFFRDMPRSDHDLLGLYSWLRDDTDDIVGVAIIPDGKSEALIHRWQRLLYVRRGGPHSAEILFRAPVGSVYRGSEENISTSRALVSQDGLHAVVFDAIGLLESDLDELRRMTSGAERQRSAPGLQV
ncbi:MAG: hypothetical protein ACRDI2_02410 [Chloroflexota bacterium]